MRAPRVQGLRKDIQLGNASKRSYDMISTKMNSQRQGAGREDP